MEAKGKGRTASERNRENKKKTALKKKNEKMHKQNEWRKTTAFRFHLQ